ncbi:MAG TPA: polysaccharide biosynthesis tyrosine autokinase [Allosphingosinicella sp.]|nr:polysaccharide biosynthesis tyrosine autokinase [Allosphingosinicella sp.]
MTDITLPSAAEAHDGGDMISRPSATGLREVQETTPLQRYWRILRRWRWVIIGSVVAGVMAALILTLLSTRLYASSVTLEIAREENRVVNIEGVQPEAGGRDQEFYQTQYGLLRSRALAERVVRELRLTENRTFLDLYGISDTPGTLASERPLDNSAGARAARQRRAVDILLQNIEISPVRLSRLVEVSYTSPSPQLSQTIVNAWGLSFIRTNIERRFEATAYARSFLENRLAELRRRLDQSERQLVGYAADQRIINVNTPVGEGVTGERPIMADDLVAYNNALIEARAARIQAESVLRNGGGASASTTSVNNVTLTGLRQRRSEVAAELARLRSQFEDEYPPVAALAAQLRQLDQSIRTEESRVTASLRGEVSQAAAREQELSGRVEQLKTGIIDLRRRSIQYNILQREVDTNRELYNGLLQRYKEIGVAGGVGTNNVSVVDAPRVPDRPSSPRPILNLFLGFIFGLAGGVGLAFGLEQLDEAITDPSEMESALGVPSLGVVPRLGSEDPLAELQNRRSALTEAYLTIKTNLQFTTAHGVPRSLLITSTRAGEGKSTTALALATILSRQGLKVVIVDSDMRSPSLHARLGLSNEKGLSNVLSGNERWDAVAQKTKLDGVYAVSAGPHPPNAADLLSGSGFDRMLADLRGNFDHVIIDAPPMLGLADAPLLASKLDGVVYVVESYGVQSRAANVALNRLRNSNARVLGAVLTKFESKKAGYGYGYDYGYGYGSDRDT